MERLSEIKSKQPDDNIYDAIDDGETSTSEDSEGAEWGEEWSEDTDDGIMGRFSANTSDQSKREDTKLSLSSLHLYEPSQNEPSQSSEPDDEENIYESFYEAPSNKATLPSKKTPDSQKGDQDQENPYEVSKHRPVSPDLSEQISAPMNTDQVSTISANNSENEENEKRSKSLGSRVKKGLQNMGRRLSDKFTHSTNEERSSKDGSDQRSSETSVDVDRIYNDKEVISSSSEVVSGAMSTDHRSTHSSEKTQSTKEESLNINEVYSSKDFTSSSPEAVFAAMSTGQSSSNNSDNKKDKEKRRSLPKRLKEQLRNFGSRLNKSNKKKKRTKDKNELDELLPHTSVEKDEVDNAENAENAENATSSSLAAESGGMSIDQSGIYDQPWSEEVFSSEKIAAMYAVVQKEGRYPKSPSPEQTSSSGSCTSCEKNIQPARNSKEESNKELVELQEKISALTLSLAAASQSLAVAHQIIANLKKELLGINEKLELQRKANENKPEPTKDQKTLNVAVSVRKKPYTAQCAATLFSENTSTNEEGPSKRKGPPVPMRPRNRTR